MRFNENQQRAIDMGRGNCNVIATAGSGKTGTLVNRIKNLIEKHGIPPKNILAITFSKKAKETMTERLATLIPAHCQAVHVDTFHSLGYRLIRQFGGGTFTVLDEYAKLKLLRQIEPDETELNDAVRYISARKNQLEPPLADADDYRETVYSLYEQEKAKHNALDFDDMLTKSYELLHRDKSVLSYCTNLYKFILIDETQDMNKAQYEIVKPNNNMFIVNDPLQNIYEWRGSNSRYVLDFHREWENVSVINLDVNYRSTEDIVCFANSETYLSYIKRLACLKREGKIGYDELGDMLLGEKNVYSSENIRKFWYLFDKLIDNIDDDAVVTDADLHKELAVKKQELQKERYKLQTEKAELNKWLREDAREELFMERITEAIRSSGTEYGEIKAVRAAKGKTEHCLFLADAHFGKEFRIYGLRGEVINEYSPEIFYQRMEKVLAAALEYIKKEQISGMKVFTLGDDLDGFLRHSQLWTLRYGVVESAVIYGKYMAKWLRALSEKVKVEYHPTSGNHGELRLLDGNKGEHLNDNIEQIVSEIVSIRNEGNPNFKLITNKTGLIFTQVAGYNLLGIHGEVRNAAQALKDFSDVYGARIDILATGHKHHGNFMNCGYRKQIAGIGSIVGSDDFSMHIRKQADATANILTFEEGKGKVNDYTIVLN